MAWTPVVQHDGEFYIASEPNTYLQYRVKFTSGEQLPSITGIQIFYLVQNRAPGIALTAPAAVKPLSGEQQIKWVATDPDGDTLTFRVEVSRDGGQDWALLTAPTSPADGSVVAADTQQASGQKHHNKGNWLF
jgi:hypothetical protein